MNGDCGQVIAFGAATPIGRTVWASAAAVRAGLSGFSEHPFMVDTTGEPMRVARAPWLDFTARMPDRCCALLFSAIDESLAAVKEPYILENVKLGLALALPARRPGCPANLARLVSDAVSARYPNRFSKIVPYEVGHAAGHIALDAAVRSVTASSTDACLVAAVDSYLPAETLEWLEACDQLHGAGPLNNAWGFVPGEAAGSVLVTTERMARRAATQSLGEIVGVGLGRETRLIKTDSVCIGDGLTQAFRVALAAIPSNERIDNVFCDLNGETYRADEYGFTALRMKDRFRAATDFIAPADCWGDLGAAGAVLHVTLGLVAHRKGYAKGPLSMVCASSESGERGATVIRGLKVERT